MPKRSYSTKSNSRVTRANSVKPSRQGSDKDAPRPTIPSPAAPDSVVMEVDFQSPSKHFSVNQSNFHPSILTFSGNPEHLNFFKLQILDLQKLNKWDDARTLFYLRSKLSGAALEFFVANPRLHSITSVDELFNKFELFFKSDSVSNPIIELDNLRIKSSETISQFAIRLDNLVSKLYASMSDEDQKKIKFNKLIANVSPDVRIFILQNKINSYDEALEKAIFYTQISQQNKLFPTSANANSNVDLLFEKVNLLQTKLDKMDNSGAINHLASTSADFSSSRPVGDHSTNRFSKKVFQSSRNFKNNNLKGKQSQFQNKYRGYVASNQYNNNRGNNQQYVNKRYSNNNSGFRQPHNRFGGHNNNFNKANRTVFCQLCRSPTHLAPFCHKLKEFASQSDKVHNSNLNPRAKPFRNSRNSSNQGNI